MYHITRAYCLQTSIIASWLLQIFIYWRKSIILIIVVSFPPLNQICCLRERRMCTEYGYSVQILSVSGYELSIANYGSGFSAYYTEYEKIYMYVHYVHLIVHRIHIVDLTCTIHT